MTKQLHQPSGIKGNINQPTHHLHRVESMAMHHTTWQTLGATADLELRRNRDLERIDAVIRS
jgi:hypothetical protein